MTTPIFGMAMAERGERQEMIQWIILGSSQIAGNSYENVLETENKFKFQGQELQDELDLNVYSFQFRNYDPAIGRWWQVDPKANPHESVYASMGNNPLRYIDPMGDTVKYVKIPFKLNTVFRGNWTPSRYSINKYN